MLLGWLRNRRRKSVSGRKFPDTWETILSTNVLNRRFLTGEQRERLRRHILIFVSEKKWEGCGGVTLTDEMKVTVAALAGLMVMGRQEDIYFDQVPSILIYPTGYVAPEVTAGRSGIVRQQQQARLGEAWWRGPVVLSWSETLAGARGESPGRNLVFHEFAHQLDMMNGRIADGTPPMETQDQFDRWISVLGPEFDRLVEACRRGHHGIIDCYGATSPAEFFAVLTEAFFERGASLRDHHPEVYAVIRDFYRLETAEWS
ncbi:MAG: M90 family metallopeptidase [Planctomycetaceae bacterium]